jgi:mono/diheme cytochrome c family protein
MRKLTRGRAPAVLLAVPAGILLLISWFVWACSPQQETTAALRGERIARSMGCFGCHGPSGAGRVGDPTTPAGTVPGWDSGTAVMYIKSVEEIREWILFGAPRGRAEEVKAAHRGALIPMPAYEGLLSEKELDDLVAYLLAVSGWNPEIPDTAYEGRKIALRLGCFGCHGPSGTGGVQNPGSFTGYIPPWQGDGFAELVRTEQELREWILDGRIQRLWENPAARHYLKAQKIQMPPYRRHVSEQELDKIVAFIGWLRSR